MHIKTTDELNLEIKSATDIEDFLTKNKSHLLTDSLPEHLNTLLLIKDISRADVVRGSLLDWAYVYQIFSGEKVPSRDKLIAIAFGLCLSDDVVVLWHDPLKQPHLPLLVGWPFGTKYK